MASRNSTRRGRPIIDLTGHVFGMWTVIGLAEVKKGHGAFWLCRCQCGRERAVIGKSLRIGDSSGCKSCRAISHGSHSSPEYCSWAHMIQRCRNPRNTQYRDYGGRGIRVRDRWLAFENFLEDMGTKPSPEHTIERIDNSLGYFKDNCTWSTRAEQPRNTRRTRLITYGGRTMCVADWASEIGISPDTLSYRLKRWPFVEAMTTPPGAPWKRRA